MFFCFSQHNKRAHVRKSKPRIVRRSCSPATGLLPAVLTRSEFVVPAAHSEGRMKHCRKSSLFGSPASLSPQAAGSLHAQRIPISACVAARQKDASLEPRLDPPGAHVPLGVVRVRANSFRESRGAGRHLRFMDRSQFHATARRMAPNLHMPQRRDCADRECGQISGGRQMPEAARNVVIPQPNRREAGA